MPDIFTRILLPVDFSVNTEISVRRAVQLIGNTESAIHLVHVFCRMRLLVKRPGEFHLLFSPRKSPLYKENLKKLGEWKTALEETLEKTKVTSEIVISNNIEKSIILQSENFHAHLIILGRHSFKSPMRFRYNISCSRIAHETRCVVMTLRPGILPAKMQTVVIPVSDFVPIRKILVLEGISRKQNLKIFLVAVKDGSMGLNSRSADAMVQTFRLLKTSFNCIVECKIVDDTNLGRGAWLFAQSIHADLMLVHPYSETNLSLLTDTSQVNSIRAGSGLQVLTIAPSDTDYYHNNKSSKWYMKN